MKKTVTKVKSLNDFLMSDLGEFRKLMYKQCVTIDSTYRKVLLNRFSHGTKLGKTIYVNFVGDNTIESLDYIGVPCYNVDTKKILLNSSMDLINPRGAGVTWFHEHGHMIDDVFGMVSDDELFRQLLDKDLYYCRYRYVRKYQLNSFEEIDKAISKDLYDMHLHSAVSDLMEGLTSGKIVNISGHGADYWFHDKRVVTSEAFAHMFECQFDQERYKEMQKYFPESLKYFEFVLNYLKGVKK